MEASRWTDRLAAGDPARLRVGYLLPTRDRAAAGDDELRPLIAQARRAETLGFDSVWVGDSPLARPRADALLVLAAIAAATERITLGTAVLLAALRHPILLAHQLSTLDRLADGRLIVGVGAGFPHATTEAQFAALGVSYPRRTSRLVESIDAVRRLWTGNAISFEGTHITFRDVALAPRPARPAGPPIWLAGSGGSALRRVAGLADGWLPYPPTWQAYAHEWVTIEQLTATAGGARPITPALYATVCLDEDPERARGRLRTSIERYYNAPLEVVESVQAMFAGSAHDCADWLRGYQRAGARHVVVRLAVDDHQVALEELAGSVLRLLPAPMVAGGRP